VRVKNRKPPWQEVALGAHWLREIDTPEFWDFLERAVAGFKKFVERKEKNPEDLMPWKVLGRKWHLSRKGFPSGKRVRWESSVLERLFELLEDVLNKPEIDWGNKQTVHFREQGATQPWATVHTKRRGGVDLTLFGEPGRFTLGRIAELGHSREITSSRDTRQAIKLRFTKGEQVGDPALKDFLIAHHRGDDPRRISAH